MYIIYRIFMLQKEEGDSFCTCVKKPDILMKMAEKIGMELPGFNEETGFTVFCGKCYNPASKLSFMPEKDEEELKEKAMGQFDKNNPLIL